MAHKEMWRLPVVVEGIPTVSKRVFVEDGEAPPPPGPPTQEAPLRPKVMRRPAQFSKTAVSVPAVETPPPAPRAQPEAPTAHAAQRVWQDDALFGLALILTLAFVNLALLLIVPYLPQPKISEEKASGLVLFGSSSMPQPVQKEGANVTTYSDPSANARLSNEFDLNRVTPEQNELSVSPKDIPVPRARALDNSEQ